MNKKVVALIGPGGGGKSTIGQKLVDIYKIPGTVNYTTREKRNEFDNDYHFVSDLEFAQKLKAKELMNCVVFNGNLYGFHKDTFNPSHILLPAIVPESIIQVHKHILEQRGELLTIFFALSEKECRERMAKRGDKPEVIEKRIQEDTIINLYGPKLANITIQTSQSIEQITTETRIIIDRFFQ